MNGAATETPEQEYDRLYDEGRVLLSRIRSGETSSLEDEARYNAIAARLREILAVPPVGYVLPKAAADLVTHAQTHGWATRVRWIPADETIGVHAKVGVSRKMTEAEKQAADHFLSEAWVYELTYHSRNCAPGVVKRFGAGLCRTPSMRAAEWAATPSLKTIREVISANPAPDFAPASLF